MEKPQVGDVKNEIGRLSNMGQYLWKSVCHYF